MTKLIVPSQASFIPGRLASNNIIIAQDIVDSFQKKKGYMGAMIVKVDLDKAYDRVNWTFLQKVLGLMGFSSTLQNLIMSIVYLLLFKFVGW